MVRSFSKTPLGTSQTLRAEHEEDETRNPQTLRVEANGFS
jgi:hypothetical protein